MVLEFFKQIFEWRKVENKDSQWMVAQLFEEIIEWRRKTPMIPDQVEFHCSEVHLSIVRRYFSLMKVECEFRELPCTRLFDDTLRNTMPESSIDYAKVMSSFIQELQEFFVVPRLKASAVRAGYKKYQAVEVFISFLLQLLCNTTDSIDPLKDRIDNLEKELRFLRTFLGDTSLQLCDRKHGAHVYELLEEFEAVANEAGSFVHSLLFSTARVSRNMRGLLVVSIHIDRLKTNIMKFLVLLPPLSSRDGAPKTSPVDSLLIVDSLIHDLEALINREDNPIADVKDQIIILHGRLVILQSSIKGIGAPQRSEIGELKQFLMRIGDMACEAEYLIVSFLVGDAPLAYLIIRLTDVIRKMRLIGTELQGIKKKNEIRVLQFAKRLGAQLLLQGKRTPKVDVITVGLEEKEVHILEHLLGGTKHLQVISIVGMPGLGKTTFAKKLYSHPSISNRFDRCSFCVISQSYKKKSVLLDIIINPTTEMSKGGVENLVVHLYQSLIGRRYFIVMDDIWDSNVWDDFMQCFPDDENGSRILITSRNKVVAPRDAIIYELPSLTNEQCWDLLEKKVFHNEHCPDELLGIGKKIAANCCGVPLAVVAVAGVLSTLDKDEIRWKKVGENLSAFIFDGGDNIVMQILELSYKHLPEHLKRCFLYFGVFSEYKEIPVQELMRLWIAEGFITMSKEQTKRAESAAEEYLMELIDKNLAIVSRRSSVGGVKACIVHDLLRDLALRKCEEENFLKFVKGSTSPAILSKFHRLKDNGALSVFDYRQNLRSFHADAISAIYASNMRLLRVLNFERMITSFAEQLFGFEFLVCLRYLCITELSASIGNLLNLEFLVVETTDSEVVIPSAILKIMKLRYIEVSEDAKYGADCSSSQRNNLEFLSTVDIFNLRDEEMLKSSPHLRKLKCICDAFRDKEKGGYRYPDLCFLTQLESLNMRGRWRLKTAEISFPLNIKKLTLRGLCLSWEETMKAIGGLPKLEVLKLSFFRIVNETWETRDGEFQQLKFLKLQNVGISQWNVASSDPFPLLQQLVLINCYYLHQIPIEIGEIATLQLIKVQGRCLKSLVESAKSIQEEQCYMGNEELRFIITE